MSDDKRLVFTKLNKLAFLTEEKAKQVFKAYHVCEVIQKEAQKMNINIITFDFEKSELILEGTLKYAF